MIERITSGTTALGAKVALFDFDGTISLIRSGWMEVMVPMMVEELAALKTGESEAELTAIVREFVGRLTGKQTMYQMIELAEQIAQRGGTPLDALQYKHRYHDRLMDKIQGRIDGLRAGHTDPAEYLVPGSIALLESLRERGLTMYLASGTDEVYMKAEAELLGVTKYFGGGVFGALDDYKAFSKAILIQRIITSSEARGAEILGFGDGYVEIQNVKQVGGVAVGVASDEPECRRVDEWKRNRLVGVGADFIVPNYEDHEELLSALFPANAAVPA
ncbi:MAG TPA: haloacid dehalogenase [Solibacterales bacterium]|nr:haloacid dehalogenase [Bryobacterales bacterium]